MRRSRRAGKIRSSMKIIKDKITIDELKEMAQKMFGNLVYEKEKI